MADKHSTWKILGIEPTKDRTVIKQAYAKLAHQISPEDDPEGYSQLHDAYHEALDYASGNKAGIVESSGESQRFSNDEFDFSAIQTSGLGEPFDMIPVTEQIVLFKKYYRIESYLDVLNHGEEGLIRIVRVLLDFYVKLNSNKHDPEAWTDFFEEPSVVMLMENEEFRHMAIHRFEDDEKRKIIASFFDSYDKQINDTEEYRKLEREKNKTIEKKSKILTGLAITFGLLALIGVMLADGMNLSPPFVVALGCFLVSASLYCVFANCFLGKGKTSDFNAGFVFINAINVLCWLLFVMDLFEADSFPYGSLIVAVIFTVADVSVRIYHVRHKPSK